jgi:hypothetical protein
LGLNAWAVTLHYRLFIFQNPDRDAWFCSYCAVYHGALASQLRLDSYSDYDSRRPSSYNAHRGCDCGCDYRPVVSLADGDHDLDYGFFFAGRRPSPYPQGCHAAPACPCCDRGISLGHGPCFYASFCAVVLNLYVGLILCVDLSANRERVLGT